MPAPSQDLIQRKPMSITARLVLGAIVQGPAKNEPSAFKSVFNRLLPPNLREYASEVADRADKAHLAHLGVWGRFWYSVMRIPLSILGMILRPLFMGRSSHFHLLLRKRFVHDEVVKSIESGAKQVLVLGAGFDVLCMMLAKKYPTVSFIEVDQPTTQIVKREVVADIYAIDGAAPNNHTFVGVDFRFQKMDEQVLLTGKWKKDADSVAVAEGLWSYLSRDEISTQLQEFRRISMPGSKIIFSFLTAGDTIASGSKFLFQLWNWIFAAILKEPRKFTPKSVEEVAAMVSADGYNVDVREETTNCYKRFIISRKYDRYVPDSHRYKNFVGLAYSK